MNHKEITEIVRALTQENLRAEGLAINVDENTPLIGSKRVFDSMGLVNLIADVETALADEGFEISLMSEEAMSLRLSPFRNVGTLSAFVERLIAEKKENR
ncbi:MAG: hypothetical protein ACI4P3_00625 [Candidatus Spyradosoma sp.]